MKDSSSHDVHVLYIELLAKAPIVPFHNDLYYWGKKETLEDETGLGELHRFWTTEKIEEDNNRISKEKMDLLHIRPVYYETLQPSYRVR